MDHFSRYAAQEVITAIGVLDDAGDGVREQEAQAAEGRPAIEGIDRMAKDEGNAGGRRETDGDELLAKDVVRKVVIRRMIISDDMVAITEMPADAPVSSRCSDFLYIVEP